jgi:flagellar hook-associated protein 1 FlgK
MSDMLTTGASGLLAFQSALTTISHNISNASTPGYNRQTVSLTANAGQPTAQGWIGNGVTVTGVTRAYNNFLYTQTLGTSSGYNQLSTLSSLAGNINNLFGDPTSGLSAGLQQFSQSLQALANAPSQTTHRQAVLSQAQTLVTQFKSYDGALGQLDASVAGQLGAEASTISTLASNIASLNQQINQASSRSQQPPNDLLDQRDQLITELSKHIGVSTVPQSDGTVSVFIGNGQPLVIGTSASTLVAGPDPFNSGQTRVFLQGANGDVDISGSLSGGTVGGILQFQEQMLTPAHNTLGQAAMTFASLVNSQNAAGLDQNGMPGGALLSVGQPRVLPSSANTGSATVSGSLTATATGNPADLGGLTTSDYYLKYDGSQWSLVDTGSGVATTLSASGSGPVTLTGAGLTLTVSGAAQAGDMFLVQPTRQAIQGLGLLTTDPSKIAAAAPLLTGAAAANTGTGTIDAGTVSSMPAWVRANYTLTFTSATTYTITGSNGQSTTGNYTAGQPISYNGFAVTISGAPQAGDSFTIKDNAAGTGDGRNALALAGVLNSKVLRAGTQSLAATLSAYVGTVGLQTSQAQDGAVAQQSAMASAQAAQQSVSGVNLDEEAANMLRYEQAYQAAAQVIKVADTLFQTLMNSVARA